MTLLVQVKLPGVENFNFALLTGNKLKHFLSYLLVAGCDIGVRFSVRPSTFMLTFDIYVKVSILINYKIKQPSNLA